MQAEFYEVLGHSQISATTASAVAGNQPPAGTKGFYISLDSSAANNATVTFDGTTPSSSNGINVASVPTVLYFKIAQNVPIKVIGRGGSTVVNIVWVG